MLTVPLKVFAPCGRQEDNSSYGASEHITFIQMTHSLLLNKVSSGGHLCYLYDSVEERLQLIADYFKQGIASRQLCVYVTATPVAAVLKQFKAHGFDAGKAIERGDLRIYSMDATYVPEGEFVVSDMMENLRVYLRMAEQRGYDGLRTAGDMRWLQRHPEQQPNAIRYETGVNELANPGSHFVGLCLYPVERSSMRLISDALQTHPHYIYEGTAQANPYYQAALAF